MNGVTSFPVSAMPVTGISEPETPGRTRIEVPREFLLPRPSLAAALDRMIFLGLFDGKDGDIRFQGP